MRIVSRHPLLRIKLSFLRVPEIHDGFEWSVYLSRHMTVQDVVKAVCERFGLVKALPVAGGGAIDYAIEEGMRQLLAFIFSKSIQELITISKTRHA